jgi:hypothetical protein
VQSRIIADMMDAVVGAAVWNQAQATRATWQNGARHEQSNTHHQ